MASYDAVQSVRAKSLCTAAVWQNRSARDQAPKLKDMPAPLLIGTAKAYYLLHSEEVLTLLLNQVATGR